MTSSRPARALLSGSVAVLVALGGLAATALPADATPAAGLASAAAGPTTSVTVFLAAPDPAALTALANQPMTNRAARMQQLRTLVPSQDQRSAAATALEAAGFTVAHQTTWSLTATAPQSLVTGLFGTPAGGLTSLPRLPAALRGLVSTAYLTTGGRPLLHQTATTTLTGTDVRHADSPPGRTPSTGGNDGALTVATLQLADFTASDLTNYASQNGIADPVAAKRYHPVRVDGGPSAMDDQGEGDIEVALDQESILSTAPTASQQPYFAPNTSAGFNDVFASAYDDVTGNAMATAPNPHLAAMSVSWGACEAAFGTAADIATTQSVIASLVAAGVNVFAASGDDGIYDCRSTTGTGLDNSQESVDFPASSPSVVAVGGTNLSAPSGTPPTDADAGTGGTSPAYDGTNWTETSWSCTSPTSCQATNVPTVGTGGTGGGVSGSSYGTVAVGTLGASDFKGFAKPAYQKSTITSGAFAGPTTRMVPDIAADADPSTGFVTYTSDTLGGATHHLQVGGTSLAAPLSAAQFTNSLGDAGKTAGVGDIHPALYSAYAKTSGLAPTDPARAFRDVVSGSNGAAGNARKDPSVNAGPGYDTNTGLGGVLWAVVSGYVQTQSQSPTVKAALHRRTVHRKHHHGAVRRIKVSWRVTPPAGNGIASTKVRVKRGHKTVLRSHRSHGHRLLALRPGRYVLVVTTTDLAGHVTTRRDRLRIHGARHRH